MAQRILIASRIPQGLSVRWFRRADVFLSTSFGSCAPISVTFVGERTMQALNAHYRKKRYATDVLSFTLTARSRHPLAHTKVPHADDELFGEVILCLPVLRRQAREKKHSLQREFEILAIHGIVHLLGYDHEQDRDAQEMERVERRFFAAIH